MKKLFISSLTLFMLSVLIGYGQQCTGTYTSSSSSSSSNCSVSVRFLGLTVWTGSVTTTTTYVNDLTGVRCTESTSSGCGVNGGSWDWPWE
jgi:hypothetical protein